MNETSRFDYIRYDDESAEKQARIKAITEQLERAIHALVPPGRAASLALTSLEECYMWCGKGIRDDQLSRSGAAPEEPKRGSAKDWCSSYKPGNLCLTGSAGAGKGSTDSAPGITNEASFPPN